MVISSKGATFTSVAIAGLLLVYLFYTTSDRFKLIQVQQIPLGPERRVNNMTMFTTPKLQEPATEVQQIPLGSERRVNNMTIFTTPKLQEPAMEVQQAPLGPERRVNNLTMFRTPKLQEPATEENIDTIQLGHKQRIYRVCALIKNGTYSVPRTYESAIRRPKGIVDNYHGVLYCDIGKTGTRGWHEFFEFMTLSEKPQRTAWFNEHPYPFYIRRAKNEMSTLSKLGFNRLSNDSESHREVNDGLPDPRRDYFRFIQVRHPLDRLASAYYSRVKSSKTTLVSTMKDKIANMTGHKPGKLSFRDFLTYVAIPDEEMVHFGNDHFKTFQTLCEPCEITYDYVAKEETLTTDLDQILPRYKSLKLKDKFPKKLVHGNGHRPYRAMFLEVPLSILQPVLDKYQADADMFGYTFDKYINKYIK